MNMSFVDLCENINNSLVYIILQAHNSFLA